MTLTVGDWICFKQLGLPCYAKLEYIVAPVGSRRTVYVTSSGECGYDDILEVRQAWQAKAKEGR